MLGGRRTSLIQKEIIPQRNILHTSNRISENRQSKLHPPPGRRRGSPGSGAARSRGNSLLYLNSNNAAEIKEALFRNGLTDNVLTDQLLTPYARKTVFTLAQNTQKFIDQYGLEKIGFLTLTFAQNIKDHKEAYRRFNTLRKHFLNFHFSAWIRVSERQKRGAWHFHILVNTQKDIRTGFDFDAYKKIGQLRESGFQQHKTEILSLERKLSQSACPSLRNLWYEMRKACNKYGFGRPHLAPIESNAEATAKYVGKYLSKHNVFREERDKGVQLVGYSSRQPRSNTKFAWHSPGAQEWRRKVEKFATICGHKNEQELNFYYGSTWAYKLKPFIFSVDLLSPDAIRNIAANMQDTSPRKATLCTDCGTSLLVPVHQLPALCPGCRRKRQRSGSTWHEFLDDQVHFVSDQLMDRTTGEILF